MCTPSKSVTTALAGIADGSSRRWATSGCHGQLLLVVDLDRRALRYLDDADAPEEPVLRLAEALGRESVERAGLEVVRLAILAARAVGGVVVDRSGLAVVTAAPEESIGLVRREDAVETSPLDVRDRLIDALRWDEGGRRLDEDDRADALANEFLIAGFEFVQRVQDCALG